MLSENKDLIPPLLDENKKIDQMLQRRDMLLNDV